MRGLAAAIIAAVLLVAAPAAQAASTEYGGGSKLRTEWEGSDTNLTLRVVGDGTVRYALAAILNCPGEDDYDVVTHDRAKISGSTVSIAKTQKLDYSPGTVVARYTIELQVAGDQATGSVRLTGTRTRGSRRAACTAKADRNVVLAQRRPAAAAPADPGPLSNLYGVVEGDRPGARPAIVIGVGSSGKDGLARWEINASCDDGTVEHFFDTAPRTAIRDRRLVRRELFRVTYADGVYARVRATTDVRFVEGGAVGTLRLRLDFRNKRGKHLTDCDSGVLQLNAFAL
jgi:hypothetical protein